MGRGCSPFRGGVACELAGITADQTVSRMSTAPAWAHLHIRDPAWLWGSEDRLPPVCPPLAGHSIPGVSGSGRERDVCAAGRNVRRGSRWVGRVGVTNVAVSGTFVALRAPLAAPGHDRSRKRVFRSRSPVRVGAWWGYHQTTRPGLEWRFDRSAHRRQPVIIGPSAERPRPVKRDPKGRRSRREAIALTGRQTLLSRNPRR